MRLDCLELREIKLALKHPFETSFGTTTNRRVMIVTVIDHSGAVGYGECVAMDGPFYNAETIETAWIIVTRHVATVLAQADGITAPQVSQLLDPIRGNRMATGAVEAAIWDLEAQLADEPLWKHIGGERTEVACGVSIGIQPSVTALLEKVAREIERGYQRIKIKIKPGVDVKLVESVRVKYPDILLSVDANSAYSLDRDLATMKELDHYGLLMIEQPFRPGNLLDHAKLQREMKTSVCLDESITSVADASDAIELRACKIINIKLGRVGGFSEAKKIQELAIENSIPIWCGGMLETGIGRAHNIALSTLPGFTLPGDVSASSRYWVEDIVDPPITVSPRGTITAPMSSGRGFEVNTQRLEACTVRRDELSFAPVSVRS
ncbi:MAG: o-succinylbenzoate synthase [Acidobacteriales bacterium]|nr:o-succinylbenzoate synthase [Terriglobales bacterium]